MNSPSIPIEMTMANRCGQINKNIVLILKLLVKSVIAGTKWSSFIYSRDSLEKPEVKSRGGHRPNKKDIHQENYKTFLSGESRDELLGVGSPRGAFDFEARYSDISPLRGQP